MNDSLWVSVATMSGAYLFFLTEEEGYPGIIDTLTGEVRFLPNAPEEIVGFPACEKQLFCKDENLYIMANNGDYLFEYVFLEDSFIKLYETHDEMGNPPESCAGKYQNEDKIVIFSRSGYIISWDFRLQELKKEQIIRDKTVFWATPDGESVWIISGSPVDLYRFDVVNWSISLYDENIFFGIENVSKSWLPVYNMQFDANRIIMIDARSVFSYIVDEKDMKVLYCSSEDDNGSRVIITGETIVIPPYSGNTLVVIDKEKGKIIKKERIIDDEVITSKKGCMSLTGEICDNDGIVYFPITRIRDRFMGIKKKDASVIWFKVKEEYEKKYEIVKAMLRKKEMVFENKNMLVDDYIKALED